MTPPPFEPATAPSPDDEDATSSGHANPRATPAPSTTHQRKTDFRTRTLAQRRKMSTADREDRNAALLAHLASVLRGFARSPRRIAAYFPIGTEPGGRLLLDVLQGEAEQIFLPVTLADGELQWGHYEGREQLSPGALSTFEPPKPHVGPEVLLECAAVIVPAVAIASDGVRMGRGGGYYDHTLQWLRTHAPQSPGTPPAVIGLVYSDEFGSDVPHEAFDAPVDIVVTDHGVTDLRGGDNPRKD